MNTNNRPQDIHAIETRLAARIASALSASAEAVPHDITERLRFARHQATAKAREVRLATPVGSSVVGLSAAGVATLGGFAPLWQRAVSLLPLLLLVFGLMAIDHWTTREQVLAAADIDARLLSDSLPPAAYRDPGFAEYLRSGIAP